MPRQLSPDVDTLLESGEGIEPVMVISITWATGHEYLYADRDMYGVKGKVLEFGELENVTRLDGNGSATSISIKLDDSDGVIKNFLDGVDLIFRPVIVYQFFNNISTSIVLFSGALATPIEWDEGTRTVTITAITKQVSQQIGFSLSESNVPIYHQSLLNKAWPMVFGSPVYAPTLALQEVPAGSIIHGFGTASQSNANQIKELETHIFTIGGIFIAEESGIDPATGLHYSTDEDFQTAYDAARAYSQSLDSQAASLQSQLDEKRNIEASAPFRPHNNVVGGYRFPQGKELICRIGEKLFKVTFLGGKTVPDNPEKDCPVKVAMYNLPLAYSKGTPTDTGGFFQAGSRVELVGELPGGYHYVASITPGIVEGVYAYRTFNGTKRLSPVPSRYWHTKTETTEGLTITYIVFPRPLGSLSYYDNWKVVFGDDLLKRYESGNEYPYISNVNWQVDWENDIYVNFRSTIGPNVVDIISWLIATYTKFDIDYDSFNYVRAKIDPYPANFSLSDRPVADQLIQDIAYQARCAVWLKSGKYYIKYLPDDAHPVDTLTESSIVLKTLKVSASSTDELATKYIATWQPDYIQPAATLVLKNNEEKYGIIEESHDFFIYNNLDLVIHSATFWLIRKSNIWKMVDCQATLDKLTLETLDDVTLSLARPIVSNAPIDCQVEACKYDSSENTINLTLWTGIRFGEMMPYAAARPANISTTVLTPLFNDVTIGARPTPTVPPFNNIQNNETTTPSGPAYTVDTPKATRNGFVRSSRPVSRAAYTGLTDIGFIYTPPIPYTPNYNYIPEPKPDVSSPSTFPTPEKPLEPAAKISKAVPGIVKSGGGKNWEIACYLEGLKGQSTDITAAETHQDSNLKGIEGEHVTVYRTYNKEGQRSYCFTSAHWAAMPVLMNDNTTGSIYPQGYPSDAIAVGVTQLQIGAGFTIPAGTIGIAVRMWMGSSFVYQVQIPVWLPKPE